MSDLVAPPPDRAGLYVLGLLRGQERREFEADLAVDPVLAMEVAAWEVRLLPLSLAIAPVEPSEAVWLEIQRILAPRESAGSVPVPASLRRRPSWRESFWDNVAVWRGIGGIAIAAALAIALLRPQPVPAPGLVAVLSSKAGPVFTVALRSDGGMNIAPVGSIKPPPGKVWQLWAVAGGEKPVPVGFVSAKPSILPAHQIPADLRKPNILMAVTVEPPGGSPTGQPDTPIVFAGPILPINGGA
ncbi:anti-sigma factor [Acidiphilium sp. PA]|uniref:anti-sigma factor n=1 Tax=Acidiphilium sp. PA TaxID=2871705 RepID=UPI002244CD6E|nr:anti-sigma factor [Acidiphilium sp. PA]MCW8306391.1 anti-sigma factor [Acidiphilium sp. PA]